MNGIHPCESCEGDGFKRRVCGCRESSCSHEPTFGDGTEPEAGLYRKYWVRRTDGSSRIGGKHQHCRYFVLDWNHDPFAVAAARAYADACEGEYPELAADLRRLADDAHAIWLASDTNPSPAPVRPACEDEDDEARRG